MRRTVRTVRAVRVLPLVAAGALVLAACADGDQDVDTGVDVGTDQTEPPDGPAEPEPGEPGVTEGEGVDRPQPGQCVDVVAAPDGVYTVADAGTATILLQDNRLVLDTVVPAAGWEHEVEQEDDDEIEIEFRREGEELDLEVEIDDGSITAQICADDD